MTSFYGRKQHLRQISELHAKPVPDHISIVGPRSIGKSALLRAVHDAHRDGSAVFAGAGIVDLRHDPPGTMEGVLARFATALRDVLAASPTFAGLAQYVRPSDAVTDVNDQLNLAFGEVADAGKRLLLILDGCDPILQNSDIPRNLWDNLRAFAQSKGLRLMTGTRAPLPELCYNPDSRTSDFFRIFYDQPLAIGAFDDEDWAEVFAQAGVSLDSSARKEIRNWTGGHPDLVEQLLVQLAESKKGPLSKDDVDAVAESMVASSSKLEAIWRDCGEENRRDILTLCRSEVSASEIPEERARYLLVRGFVSRAGTKLRLQSRLIEKKASARKADVSGIRELFGTRDAFDCNIPKLLELRLTTVPRADHELTQIIKRSIRDLSSDPGACLSSARDLLDRALDLVWNCEAPDGKVPAQWISTWKFQQTQVAAKAVLRFTSEPDIPDERGAQCDVLRFATGRQGLKSVTVKTSKTACVLIEHVKQLGDLKNHSKTPPGVSLAVAFCMTAIELCETLGRDLA